VVSGPKQAVFFLMTPITFFANPLVKIPLVPFHTVKPGLTSIFLVWSAVQRGRTLYGFFPPRGSGLSGSRCGSFLCLFFQCFSLCPFNLFCSFYLYYVISSCFHFPKKPRFQCCRLGNLGDRLGGVATEAAPPCIFFLTLMLFSRSQQLLLQRVETRKISSRLTFGFLTSCLESVIPPPRPPSFFLFFPICGSPFL